MSDTSGSGFGQFVPGFEFLQNLAGQAAGGVAQGLGQGMPQLPNLGSWVAPTFSVEDLEKRIAELKAVHFWLDQNSKALAATIQALEVQKMTLATLKNMNFSLGDVANALKVKPAETPAPTPTQFAGLEIPPRTYGTPAPAQPEADAGTDEEATTQDPAPATAPAGGVVDPVQWWGALSQQFQHIAANALKEVAQPTALDAAREAASDLAQQALKTATDMAGQAASAVTPRKAAPKPVAKRAAKATPKATGKATGKATPKPAARAAAKPAAQKAPVRKPAAAPKPVAAGDWTLPGGFFQMPGLSLGGAAAPKKARPVKKAAAPAAPKPAAKKAAAQQAAPARRRR